MNGPHPRFLTFCLRSKNLSVYIYLSIFIYTKFIYQNLFINLFKNLFIYLFLPSLVFNL